MLSLVIQWTRTYSAVFNPPLHLSCLQEREEFKECTDLENIGDVGIGNVETERYCNPIYYNIEMIETYTSLPSYCNSYYKQITIQFQTLPHFTGEMRREMVMCVRLPTTVYTKKRKSRLSLESYSS